MPRVIVWTQETDDTVRECVETGETLKSMEDELGCSRVTIRQRVRKLGLRLRKGPRPDPHIRLEIISLIQDGFVTCRSIAGQMGVGHSRIEKLVNELIDKGLVRRWGMNRGSRLSVTQRWSRPYMDVTDEHMATVIFPSRG